MYVPVGSLTLWSSAEMLEHDEYRRVFSRATTALGPPGEQQDDSTEGATVLLGKRHRRQKPRRWGHFSPCSRIISWIPIVGKAFVRWVSLHTHTHTHEEARRWGHASFPSKTINRRKECDDPATHHLGRVMDDRSDLVTASSPSLVRRHPSPSSITRLPRSP